MIDHPDYVLYQKSINGEIQNVKDRIRYLVGDHHWLSDGEHKETILRKILVDRIPEAYSVRRGFVCYHQHTSTQLDILITNKSKPTLYQEGDLVFVSPDCVEAVIEVKTALETNIKSTIQKLVSVGEVIRRSKPNKRCWLGLFVFDEPRRTNSVSRLASILRACRGVASGEPLRAINCVSIGSKNFIRYWESQRESYRGPIRSYGWHSYIFRENHDGLAPAYFIGNLVAELSTGFSNLGDEYSPLNVWFPIQDDYGKEQYHIHWTELSDNTIHTFEALDHERG